MFFHGSEHKINSFTDDFVGGKEAHDQEGPGIYFTSSWKNARSYGPYVYIVKLNPKKLVSIQDGKNVSIKEIEWLMKNAPNWEMHAENFNENPNLGVKIAAKNALEYNDNPHQQFLQVWIDFYRNNPVDYVRNMVKLGYDAVKIEGLESILAGQENITHIIVLNPSVIEFVEMEDDRSEEEKGQIEEAANSDEYVYHGTSKGAAYRIQREGNMKPGQASGSPSAPLFFSNQEQYASTYASRKDSSGGVLLRLKKTPDMKEATNISNKNGSVEYYTFREIPVQEIEVKLGDNWIPISEFSFVNEIRKFVRKTLSENVENNNIVFLRNTKYSNSGTIRKLSYEGIHAWAVRKSDLDKFFEQAYYQGSDKKDFVEISPNGKKIYALNFKIADDYVKGNSDVEPELEKFNPNKHVLSFKEMSGKKPMYKYHSDLDYQILMNPSKENLDSINEDLLSEDYESVKQIKDLANHALVFAGAANADYVLRQLKEGLKLHLYPVKLLDVYQEKSNSYSTLQDFIINSNVLIQFTPSTGKKRLGSYTWVNDADYDKTRSRSINLYYDATELGIELDKKLKEYNRLDAKDIYFSFWYKFASTLEHELQHAYDDYRSNSNIFRTKQSQKFDAKYATADEPADEIAAGYKYKEYLNLQHEIWARFTQAISKTRFSTLDFAETPDGRSYVHYKMHPLADAIKNFRYEFSGWQVLPEKMKKKLIAKASQFWHKEKDELPEKNKKEIEKLKNKEPQLSELRKFVRKTLNENRNSGEKKYANCHASDLIRMDMIETFFKSVDEDPDYNVEAPEYDMLLDAWDGYDQQSYIQNELADGKIIFWEGWSSLCWEGLYAKPEYKGLSKQDSIKKIFRDRIPRIAQEFNMTVEDANFFWHQTGDEMIEDGYIMKVILKKSDSTVKESYDDVGLDYIIKKRPKLKQYNEFINKKIVNGFTYLNFKPDAYFMGSILVFDNADDTEVANSSYGKEYEGGVLKATIDVRNDKRRRGIATEIYKWIEELTGETIYPEPIHSYSAEKFWNQPNRPFGEKTINEGPIWNQGGIVLIKGAPIENGKQRLFATSAKNLIEIKPGEYFYSGPNKKGKEIYISKGPDEYEGLDEDLEGGKEKLNKYVYHTSSPKNRERIEQNGIVPFRGDQWLSDTKIGGNAVFATNSENPKDWFDSTYDDDVWKIDTTKIPDVKWFMDPNFSWDKKYKHIYTKSNIPRNAIELIKKGTGADLLELYSLKDVQSHQSTNKPSSDIIFDSNEEDKFELVEIHINSIKAPNNLSLDFYKKKGLDEDVYIVEKLIHLIDDGIKITPLVVDENMKIMDGLHRYVAYKELYNFYNGNPKIKVYKRIK